MSGSHRCPPLRRYVKLMGGGGPHMNPCQKVMLLSMFLEDYRTQSKNAIAKLVDNYRRISVQGRYGLIKKAVDYIERMNVALKEIAAVPSHPVSGQMYLNISQMLASLQRVLLFANYNSNDERTVRHLLNDLSYVAMTLDIFRSDLIKIMRGKNIPEWYTNVSSDTYRRLKELVEERYYQLYNEPLKIFLGPF